MQGATLIQPLRNIGIVAMLALIAPARADEGKPVESAHIECGELSVTFRDNSQSPQLLSGIDSLFNTAHAADYDAFDPDAGGAAAGLNLEHIISGHANPNIKFTPRQGPYSLRKLPDGKSVVLLRRAEESPWKVASTLEHTVRAPYYIDFVFRCTPHDASL